MSERGGSSPAQVSGTRPRWLVVDSRKLRVSEYRRLAPNVVVLGVVMLIKLVRLRMKFPQAVPYDAHFVHVDESALPAWARQALHDAGRDRLGGLGLEPRFLYTMRFLGTTESFALVLVDAARTVMMQLMTSRTVPLEPNGKVEIKTATTCHTKVAGGWVATTNNGAHLDPPDAFRGEVVTGDAARVLARQRERIAGALADVVSFAGDDAALDRELAEHHHVVVTDFMKRGVYVEPDAEELDELERKTTAARSLGRD